MPANNSNRPSAPSSRASEPAYVNATYGSRPLPRKQGWVVVYRRPGGYVFEPSPYTEQTQSQALALALKQIKGSFKESVDQCNYYIGEIKGLQDKIKMLETLVPDDSAVSSPAEPGEPESPPSEQQASYQGMSEVFPSWARHLTAHNPGGTQPPEPVTPTHQRCIATQDDAGSVEDIW